MTNGTHHPKTKKQLSDLELELLKNLIEVSETGAPLATSRQIGELMSWDIRQTTSTLSSLVGMDLCVETDMKVTPTNSETGEFSSSEPRYGIPLDGIIYKRAIYARDRIRGSGYSLWHLLHKNQGFGDNLWPFRPVDRIKIPGRIVNVAGLPTIDYEFTKELYDLIGKDVTITIQS